MLCTSCINARLYFILKDGQTAVMVAVEKGQLEVVQEFLKECCDVNYQEKVLRGLDVFTKVNTYQPAGPRMEHTAHSS
jgi:uncharacterized protein YaaQ